MNMISLRTINTYLFSLMLIVTLTLALSVSAYADEKKVSSNRHAQQVKFKARTDDDFMLTADYYAGTTRAGGVIVLHDCKSDRSRYNAMANALFQRGLHTLTLDLRGYGASISPEFSRDIIKQNATDLVSYQSEMALLTTYWQDDLVAAYQFLRSKVDKNQGIAIVTSGCSAAYGAALAEKILLNSIVMITPQMTFADKERYKKLIDIPSYFITSAHHMESNQVAQELFAWNGSKESKIQTFKGSRYGYYLIAREKSLIDDISQWINSTVTE